MLWLLLVSSVTLAVDDAPSLTGRTWLVEDIAGKGVIDSLQTTLEIDADGKVSGNGGCNRYFGSAKVDGTRIEFGPMGATRKMCPPAIMNQEDSFMRTLATIKRFDLKNGLLFLYGKDDEPVLRFSELPR